MSFNPITLFETPKERVGATGQFIALAVDRESATYSIGVINGTDRENDNAFAVFKREDLLGLRDALNKEFSS